jgi:hypothetical protein
MKYHQLPKIDLIADGISDPRNVPALLACAEMFQIPCFFRDRYGLAAKIKESGQQIKLADAPPLEVLRRDYDLILGVETSEKAQNIFDYLPPQEARIALVVGNERFGLDRRLARIADHFLEIPMCYKHFTLNVVSAAAAALYQIMYARARGRAGGMGKCSHRPEVILLNPVDSAELGSSLRTAWALGWHSVCLSDQHKVWYTKDRSILEQGRGAARRHKNPIKVRPIDLNLPIQIFDVGILVTYAGGEVPLWKAELPLWKKSCAVIFPDEISPVSPESLECESIAKSFLQVFLDTPALPQKPYFRLLCSIGLTEVFRWIS